MAGGSGTSDPSRFARQNVTLALLVQQAYGLKPYQLIGPAWLTVERYDVTAKIPEGASADQVPLMLQNLLSERFQMTVQRDRRAMPVYELVVAKDGPKFKEWVEPPAPKDGASPVPSTPQPKPAEFPKDAEGFPILPLRVGAIATIVNGRMLMSMHSAETMGQLVGAIASQVDRPVSDQTGLKGTYEIVMRWVSDWTPAARGTTASAASGTSPATPEVDPLLTLTGALEAQLGLRLESKKATMDVLVVEHAEKVPKEN